MKRIGELARKRLSSGQRVLVLGSFFCLWGLIQLVWNWTHGRYDARGAGSLTGGILVLGVGWLLVRKERRSPIDD